ncbi:hypothetical protein B1810_17410 [Panacagrimonas perspica]|nr:hypothetical protein B1810_17410 [Panacagrimonas perspica]
MASSRSSTSDRNARTTEPAVVASSERVNPFGHAVGSASLESDSEGAAIVSSMDPAKGGIANWLLILGALLALVGAWTLRRVVRDRH